MPEAQASLHWIPPGGPLGELTERSRVRAKESAMARGELEAIVFSPTLPPAPSFSAALRRVSGEGSSDGRGDARGAGQTFVAVIAELKRSSPSKGMLNATLDAHARTAAYAEGGAAALSILTEPSRFGGSLSDLREARSAVTIPLLRKDFITSAEQVLEARAYGASAVLLIARALAPAELDELAAAATACGLEPLIEVRDEAELARALRVREAVIGVNNRDLETLVIDPTVGARIIPQVPADRVAVYESGVVGVEGVERAAAVGADAVLVGSSLSTADDPAGAVRALSSVPRRPRG